MTHTLTGTAVDLTAVSVRFLSRRAQTAALADIDLRVRPGELVTIVGPSGCGKSTLLKLVAGLVKPTSGTVTLMGRPVTRPQKDIGFVFQKAALLEWRGARKNILLQAEMRRMDRALAARRADDLMKLTGLNGFERALLHQPPVLLMDEPFGALDALTREQLNTEVNRIWRETGTTTLLVTHSIAEAVFLGTRVVVMSPRPGRIVRIFDVDLPASRDYARVMSDPRFERLAAEIRGLLGPAIANH